VVGSFRFIHRARGFPTSGEVSDVRKLNEEVLVADEELVRVSALDVGRLKTAAAANERRRIRILAHRDVSDSLHEMLIVHARGVYVRPHKHVGKSESLHVIEGEADVVFFGEDGSVREVVPIGSAGSGRAFYYRLAASWYHTLLLRSDFLVFHEVTNGPFKPEDTLFAPWAPDEGDPDVAAFQERIGSAVAAAR
jgi:cupin fold WbuC family metalloprotein